MNKHLILATLLLGTAHLSLAQNATPNQPTEKFDTYKAALDASRKYYYDGDKAQALTIMKQAADLAKNPEEKFGALARVAQIYTDIDDNAKATATWQSVLGIEGISTDEVSGARAAIAGLLLIDGKYAEARSDYQEMIDNSSNDEIYHLARYQYAVSYYNEGKCDEALSYVDLIMEDPRMDFAYQGYAMKLAGWSHDKKADLKSARKAYVSSLNYFQQAIKAKQVDRSETKSVYAALLADYEKEYGFEAAQKQAIALFNPLQTDASKLRLAQKNKEALPYYQAIDGINPYLPILYKLLMREGLGSTLMYSGYFEQGNEVLREVADTVVPADDDKLNYVVQNARRMLALSYKFEGEVKGGKEQFAKSREELDTLFALPNLRPDIAKRAQENLKELNRFDPQ